MIKVNDIVKINSIEWIDTRHEDIVKCGYVAVVNYIYPRGKYRLFIPQPDGSRISKVILKGDLEVLEDYEDKERLLELAEPIKHSINRINELAYGALLKMIVKEINEYRINEASEESLNRIKKLYEKIDNYDIKLTDAMKDTKCKVDDLYKSII